MCLAQGQYTVKPVRLEPAAPRSLVKHSNTEPLCSPYIYELTSLNSNDLIYCSLINYYVKSTYN